MCKNSYASKGDLVKHITKAHGDAVYKCQHCSAGFQYKSDLRDHYRIHYINDEEIIESEIQDHEYQVIEEEVFIK